MTHMFSRLDPTRGEARTQSPPGGVAHAPRGLIYSTWLLGAATMSCAFAVVEGGFVMDAKNNAFVNGNYFAAWLGHNPFGWRTLPWLIADVALPLGAALWTFLAYHRLTAGLHSARAVGLSAIALALIAVIVSLLAAGWMFEAGSGNPTGQQPWYFNQASVSVLAFAGASASEFVAAIITLVTVLRHRAKSRRIIKPRRQSKPSAQAGSN